MYIQIGNTKKNEFDRNMRILQNCTFYIYTHVHESKRDVIAAEDNNYYIVVVCVCIKMCISHNHNSKQQKTIEEET